MWHSDKPLVQEDLCNAVKDLTKTFVNVANTIKFVSAFFTELSQTWDGIDIFRINKYDRLVRRVLEGLYDALAAHSWDPAFIAQANAMLIAGPYRTTFFPPFPASLTMHVNDVIIDAIDQAADKAPAECEGTTLQGGAPIFYFEDNDVTDDVMNVEKDDDDDEEEEEEKDKSDGEEEEKEEKEKEKIENVRVVPHGVTTKLLEPFVHYAAYGQSKVLYKEIQKKIFAALSVDTEWPHIERDTEGIRKEVMAVVTKAEEEIAKKAVAENSDSESDEGEKKKKNNNNNNNKSKSKSKRRKRVQERGVFLSRLMDLAMTMHAAKKTRGAAPSLEDVPSVNELVSIFKEKYSQDKKKKLRPRTKGPKKVRHAQRKKNLNRKRKKFFSSINK